MAHPPVNVDFGPSILARAASSTLRFKEAVLLAHRKSIPQILPGQKNAQISQENGISQVLKSSTGRTNSGHSYVFTAFGVPSVIFKI